MNVPEVGSKWGYTTSTWGAMYGTVVGYSVHFRWDDGSESVYEPEEWTDFEQVEE